MSTTATATLVQSWGKRYGQAVAVLLHAEKAPALFKPEHVEQARETAAHAEQQWTFWSSQETES